MCNDFMSSICSHKKKYIAFHLLYGDRLSLLLFYTILNDIAVKLLEENGSCLLILRQFSFQYTVYI